MQDFRLLLNQEAIEMWGDATTRTASLARYHTKKPLNLSLKVLMNYI